ncbi:hypothetical protein [Hafnia paralvei]|jgi:hypothetical protein
MQNYAKPCTSRMHGLIREKGRDLRGFFDGRLSGQLCAVRLINFPLFHTDNIAQGLQASGGTAITGDNEFVVFLFCVGQLLFAVSQAVLVF